MRVIHKQSDVLLLRQSLGVCKCVEWRESTAARSHNVSSRQGVWVAQLSAKEGLYLLNDKDPQGQRRLWKICFSYRLRSSAPLLDVWTAHCDTVAWHCDVVHTHAKCVMNVNTTPLQEKTSGRTIKAVDPQHLPRQSWRYTVKKSSFG